MKQLVQTLLWLPKLLSRHMIKPCMPCFQNWQESGTKKQLRYFMFTLNMEALLCITPGIWYEWCMKYCWADSPWKNGMKVEGAFIQGLGMMTSEHVLVDDSTGKLITDSTWNYKPPTAACIPQQMFIDFLKVCWSQSFWPHNVTKSLLRIISQAKGRKDNEFEIKRRYGIR